MNLVASHRQMFEKIKPPRSCSGLGWLYRSALRPRLWLLGRRGARAPLLGIALLVLILAAVLAICFTPVFSPDDAKPPRDLASLLGVNELPASPGDAGRDGAVEPAPLLGKEAAQSNAAMPFVALGPAARPFRFAGAPGDRLRARACLAAAMLYEAGDNGIGQLAVGQVVLNRLRHPAFPGSICGVVAQGSDRHTGCQFTFTCDGSLARPSSPAARARALSHADLMLDGMVFGGVGLATHYHTVDVYPWWSPKLEKIARAGTHLFFRWPGRWGSAAVVRTSLDGHEPSAVQFASFVDHAAASVELSDRQQAIASQGNFPTMESIALAQRVNAEAKGLGAANHAVTVSAQAIPLSRRLPQTSWSQPSNAERNLAGPMIGGSRVMRTFPDEGVFFLLVTPQAKDAALRKVAELLCGGRGECHVYGWRSAVAVPPTIRIDADARAALAFSFVRVPPADKRVELPPANAF